MKNENKSHWNAQHKKLQSLLKGKGEHEEIMGLFRSQHLMTHSQSISDERLWSFHDEVFKNLSEEAFRTIPPRTKNSIAWHIWHATRVEDMTMNVLVREQDQILSERRWHERLGIPYVDTGNSMTAEGIRLLSSGIDYRALSGYRNDVGKATQRILSALRPDDLKRGIDEDLLKRLVSEKAVDKGSIWLLDFWGKKTVAGLLLMPATRHNVVHLNKSADIKKRVMGKKRSPAAENGGL